MSLLVPILVISVLLVLIFFCWNMRRPDEPCAVKIATDRVDVLIIRRLHGGDWVLCWKNFQGWGYDFKKNAPECRASDRVALEFTNVSVEVRGTNLKRIREGVIAYTLSLLQEVTDGEARCLSKRGEPVIRKIVVTPASVTEVKMAGHQS